MKKLIALLSIIIVFCTIIFIACSENVENTPDEETQVTGHTTHKLTGEVPRNVLFYSTYANAAKLSTLQLIETYKKDISNAELDYKTNLKNMWFAVINPRIYKDGNEEQIVFAINEQLSLDNNLAHFSNFYNLLSASNSISKVDKMRIADTYYNINFEAIKAVKWRTEADRSNKEMELLYAKRNFQNLLNTKK